MQLGQFGKGPGMQGFRSGQPAPNLPRYRQLKIDHRGGTFTIDNTGLNLGRSLDVVALGLLLSRTYWTKNDAAESKVACRSHDSIEGHPSGAFPWHEFLDQNLVLEAHKQKVLPCKGCAFAGRILGESQPRCKPTWTLPVVLGYGNTANLVTQSHGMYAPSEVLMMPFTASSIPNLKTYLTPFRGKTALYKVVTRITLQRVSKGSNTWSEATFIQTGDTADTVWEEFSEKLRQVKEFMQPKNESKEFTPLPLA